MAKQHRLKEVADLIQTGAFQLLIKREKIGTDFGKIQRSKDGTVGFDMTMILDDSLITYRITVQEMYVRGGG